MKQSPKTFSCHRCGYSCSQIVVLSQEDVNRITKAGIPEEQYIKEDQLGKKQIIIDQYNGKFCHFFRFEKKDGKVQGSCRIYKSRPNVCRDYPFFGATKETSTIKETAVCCPKQLWIDGKFSKYLHE